jgi:hypothetical protein
VDLAGAVVYTDHYGGYNGLAGMLVEVTAIAKQAIS